MHDPLLGYVYQVKGTVFMKLTLAPAEMRVATICRTSFAISTLAPLFIAAVSGVSPVYINRYVTLWLTNM